MNHKLNFLSNLLGGPGCVASIGLYPYLRSALGDRVLWIDRALCVSSVMDVRDGFWNDSDSYAGIVARVGGGADGPS